MILGSLYYRGYDPSEFVTEVMILVRLYYRGYDPSDRGYDPSEIVLQGL
jgi:hypothetical protein